MTFQKTVVIVGGIVLAISLLVIAYLAYGARSNVSYPPVSAQCPDFWKVQKMGEANMCVNTKNLGKASCPTSLDFTVSPWTGDKGLCRKRDWARECDITWDGVTNVDLKC